MLAVPSKTPSGDLEAYTPAKNTRKNVHTPKILHIAHTCNNDSSTSSARAPICVRRFAP